jgi:hypothetical protein
VRNLPIMKKTEDVCKEVIEYDSEGAHMGAA